MRRSSVRFRQAARRCSGGSERRRDAVRAGAREADVHPSAVRGALQEYDGEVVAQPTSRDITAQDVEKGVERLLDRAGGDDRRLVEDRQERALLVPGLA